jgi:hypothetical protein
VVRRPAAATANAPTAGAAARARRVFITRRLADVAARRLVAAARLVARAR